MTSMTSITDNTAPDVLVGAAGEPDAVQVDLRPARRALVRDSEQWHGPAALRYEQFPTVAPDATSQFFAAASWRGWGVSELTSRSAITHRRCDTGLIAVDEVLVQGRLC